MSRLTWSCSSPPAMLLCWDHSSCTTYLFSIPPASPAESLSSLAQAHTGVEGAIGAALLFGYLAFNGLTSTLQERLFGKNDNSTDPFGPKSPVLNQMIWTNVWSSAIALVVAAGSHAATAGSVLPSLRLLVTSPALAGDVLLLSAANTVGVIILINTIASFGALQASLIMSVRQFASILCNATLLGTAHEIGLEGWCGVGWVAAGAWIQVFGPEYVTPIKDTGESDDEKEYPALSPHSVVSPLLPQQEDALPRPIKPRVAQA